MRQTTSRDGTTIAYDRRGGGPALLVLGGALADHRFYLPLAGELAASFTVHTPDRRGRGASGDTAPYAVDREVEDVAALVDAAGGRAHLYGHSAGAALALRAAAAGVAVDRLVLADPPFTAPGGDDAAARAEHAAQARDLARAVAAGDRGGAVRSFVGGFGLPADALEDLLASPAGEAMAALAHTLPYDYAVLGDGLVPAAAAARVRAATLVLAAGADPAAARALAAALPDAALRTTRAMSQELPAAEVAALVTPFLLAGAA